MPQITAGIKKILRKGKDYFAKSFSDYRVTMAGICFFTIYEAAVLMLCYEYDVTFPFEEEFPARALILFLSAAFLIESRFAQKKPVKAAGFLAAGVVSAVLSFGVGLSYTAKMESASVSASLIAVLRACAARSVAGYLLLTSLLSVYACFRKTAVSFEEYLVKVFYNLMRAFLIWFFMAVGTAFLGAALDTLFFDGFSQWRNVPQIFVFGFYFAPQCILAFTDMKEESAGLMQMIVQYVLSALTVCAMALVYLYLFKILICREIPSNEVFSIVSMLFAFGMPVWMMAGYYEDRSRRMRVLSRMPYLFAPLICLQVYSMGVRIGQYGMTPERYAGMMLIVFEIGALLIWRFQRKHCERMVPFLCILVTVSVFAPGINMFRVSNLWQEHFLRTYYESVCGGTQLTRLEYERLKGAYAYLWDQPGTGVSEKFPIYDRAFTDKLNVFNEAENDLTKTQRHTIFCAGMAGELDVEGYSRLYLLNQDSAYAKKTESGFQVVYPGQDGNRAVIPDGNGVNVDFSCFRFVKQESGEVLTVDLFAFVSRCMNYLREHPDAGMEEMSREMRDCNRIELDADTVLYLNQFEVVYRDGISEGKPYFEWMQVRAEGVLLVK